MTGLPLATGDDRRFFDQWLTTFASYVRDVDYESARPLFHNEVLTFGTHRDVMSGLDIWVNSQWDNVWPRTSDFAFDLENTEVLLSTDGAMATVITPWGSTGYHSNGTSFDRPGRATMVFHRDSADGGGQWVCVHSHMSLNRGVPQESFADRPRKV